MTTQLRTYLDSLTTAPERRLGPVTILPLTAAPTGPEVALLAPDSARVVEHGGGGRVGSVRVENLAPEPLLLLAGEILEGAKQDRLVNASTLIAPGAEVALRVSCVERGRWGAGRGDGRHFTSRARSVPWELRSRSSYRASMSKRAGGVADAAQGAVWADVDSYLGALGVLSRTAALTEGVQRVRVDDVLGDWSPGPDEVGAALFLGERLVGFELFGRPATWSSASRRVLSGLVFDAPEGDEAAPDDAGATFEAFRERLRALELVSAPGESEGTELHGERGCEHIVALLHDDGVVHVRAASLREPIDGPGRGPRWEGRAMQRRRRRRAAAHERAQAIYRVREIVGEAGPSALTLSRWFLLVKAEAAVDAIQRSLADTGRSDAAVPLPHVSAHGLAAWEAPNNAPLVALAGLLTELGCADDDWVLGHAGALHDSPVPAWASIEPTADGARVTRTPDER